MCVCETASHHKLTVLSAVFLLYLSTGRSAVVVVVVVWACPLGASVQNMSDVSKRAPEQVGGCLGGGALASLVS